MTAQENYQKYRQRIANQIERLQGILADHEVEQSQDVENWCFASELAHANEKLAEVLDFLTEVLDFLGDEENEPF